MTAGQPPKTLLMLVTQKWLVEMITSLGSGYLTHLAYKNDSIEPKVLDDIQNKQLEGKVLGEIIFQDQREYHRVAEVEIAVVNDFETFIRFDLRLLEVSPFVRGKIANPGSGYLCFYK
ncbi:MAG: hypothetical protein ACM3X9_09300 [Bacillota bacterium]